MKVLIPVTVPAYAEVDLSPWELDEIADEAGEFATDKSFMEDRYLEKAKELFEESPRGYVIVVEGSRGIADPKDAVISN